MVEHNIFGLSFILQNDEQKIKELIESYINNVDIYMNKFLVVPNGKTIEDITDNKDTIRKYYIEKKNYFEQLYNNIALYSNDKENIKRVFSIIADLYQKINSKELEKNNQDLYNDCEGLYVIAKRPFNNAGLNLPLELFEEYHFIPENHQAKVCR